MSVALDSRGLLAMPLSRSETYHERAKSAARAAILAESLGHAEIADAYRNIEAMWLRLARQAKELHDGGKNGSAG